MAVAKAQYLKPLKPGQLSVNHQALIIGGGLAGITAALSLADQGFASFVIEKEDRLGGNYNHLYKTLEGLDTRAHLKGLLEKVYNNPLITVVTGAHIEKIEGFIGNYKTTVKNKDGEKVFEHGVVLVAIGAYENEPKEYLYKQNAKRAGKTDLRKGSETGRCEKRSHDSVCGQPQ